MNLTELHQEALDPLTKNLPVTKTVFRHQLAEKHWNVLREDLPLPLAILNWPAVQHNARWMRDFLAETGVAIAPHGKTSMSPQLYQLQLTCGAWGITAATLQQIKVCHAFGVKRVLLANQLVGKSNIAGVLELLKSDPQFTVYILVDSLANLAMLREAAKVYAMGRPLPLLIEMGYVGGRAGCRDIMSAITLAKAIREAEPYLALCGVECFEGFLVSGHPEQDAEKVRNLLATTTQLAEQCEEQGLFSTDTIILTAGGSAFYDIVAEQWASVRLKTPVEVVLRSGCYLTHDSLFYKKLFQSLQHRVQRSWLHGSELKPALEVWSYVQSCPEPGLVILTMGKRDCSYDIDLPIPLKWARAMQPPSFLTNAYIIFKLDDQHAHMRVPLDCPLQVGDMIGCGISHPCTTFDKWREIFVVDDDYNVVSSIKTYF